MLNTHIRLRAVRSNELRLGAKDRRSDSGNGSESATTPGCLEHGAGLCIGGDLLEGLHSILLDCAIEKGQRQPIIGKTKAGADHPFFRRAPSQGEPQTEVIRVSTAWR